MRRNWLTILIFALALAIQVVAPAAVNVALGAGATAVSIEDESGAAPELCLKDGWAADRSQSTPGHLKGHRDACLLCQTHLGGSGVPAPQATTIGRAPVHWTALSWTAADRALPLPARDYARQARGPPTLS